MAGTFVENVETTLPAEWFAKPDNCATITSWKNNSVITNTRAARQH
ncbi:hypothetical protein LCM19_10620 [Qipengyuania flava]|nr:hypothetical protein [Qipengyuania flava]